jgi:hypothetical protein
MVVVVVFGLITDRVSEHHITVCYVSQVEFMKLEIYQPGVHKTQLFKSLLLQVNIKILLTGLCSLRG